MKWRITGTWTNLDAAAHRPILIVKGFDHRGVVEPTDTMHRVPAQLWLETVTSEDHEGRTFWGLGAGLVCPLAHTFEMDEVAEVLTHEAGYGMLCAFRIELADDPAAPESPG